MTHDKQRIRESLEMTRLFMEITDPENRRKLLEMARELACKKPVKPN